MIFIVHMLWGIKPKKEMTEQGNFICPQCNGASHYKKWETKAYFYVLFIPIYSVTGESLLDTLECQNCQLHFDHQALLSVA